LDVTLSGAKGLAHLAEILRAQRVLRMTVISYNKNAPRFHGARLCVMSIEMLPHDQRVGKLAEAARLSSHAPLKSAVSLSQPLHHTKSVTEGL
jgi:hypothetical protein